MSDINPDFRDALDPHIILLRYTLFAIIAGLTNLGSQEIVVRLAPWAPLMASLVIGLGVGFFVKYALDKRWIYLDRYHSHAAEIRKIMLYGTFGVGTTLVFWAFELGALEIWRTDAAKYAGAVAGLVLGNWLKYLLDRRYVFRTASRQRRAQTQSNY